MKILLKEIRRRYIKDLTEEFLFKLKCDYPYYSKTYLTKIEAIREFREWWEEKEVW